MAAVAYIRRIETGFQFQSYLHKLRFGVRHIDMVHFLPFTFVRSIHGTRASRNPSC